MKELSIVEVEEVSGGVAPLVLLAAAAAVSTIIANSGKVVDFAKGVYEGYMMDPK
jgi:lactobin A/cerein 7B family class IIb bacteriocin